MRGIWGWLLLGWLVWLPLPPEGLAAPARGHAWSEEEKIALLIESVRDIREGARFIRNGTEYGAAEAAAHLNRKYSRAKSRVKTAGEFIKHVASRSSLSGKEYLIRYPDGTAVTAEEFFMDKLRKLKGEEETQIP